MVTPDIYKWKEIADDFELLWNFPNCMGALDGKHCNIIVPAHSISAWFDYKSSFSMVLMALSDAHLRFTWVNIGAKGSGSDSMVFQNIIFGQKVIQDQLDMPQDREFHPGFTAPYIFIADEAFPARENLLRPYPGGWSGELSAN